MMQKLMRMYRSVNTQSLLRMYRSVNTQSLLKMYRSVNIQSLLKKGLNDFIAWRNSNRLASVQSYWNCSTEPLWSPLSPSTVLPSLAAWGREHSLATLSKITKTASKWIGAPVTELQSHFEAKAVKRLRVILRDLAHPVQGTRQSDYSISNT